MDQNSNPSNSRKERKERATIRSELQISKQLPQASRDESLESRLREGRQGQAHGLWHLVPPLPPFVPALSPSCRRLPLLYLGHLIRRQFPDHSRVKGRKLAAEAVSKKTGVHPEGQNGPLATFPSNPEWSFWAALWREQTFQTKP